LLEGAGQSYAEQVMGELRVLHLTASPTSKFSVLQKLTKAYQATVETDEGRTPSVAKNRTG